MAIPGSVYTEDESARQTLANGTVLKWTKQLENIHQLNSETDLSIAYTHWSNEPMMTYANRGFHQWQGGCTNGGDLGYNQSPTYSYQHATGIKQNSWMQPRMENLQTHVVISNGGGYYVWGKNTEWTGSRISGSSGNQRRYLLDADINKMLFNCTVTVVDKSFFDNVDYLTNPENMPAPSEHNISLKELIEHPDLYYCTGMINWSNAYVYGENTSDHWRSVAIRPSFIITGENISEYMGEGSNIFGSFTANGSFSYDSRDPNGHATFGGGGSSNTLYSRMNSGYFMGCGDEIDMTPFDTFDSAGGQAVSNGLSRWGAASNWNHFCYVNGQLINYGASMIWSVWGSRAYNVPDTGTSYRDYSFGLRRYIKPEKMSALLASFGLYFMTESFDPDSANLTPETLGNDSRIILGEMLADGTTNGHWITDIDSYTGINKDGKTVNPAYDPAGGGGGSGTDEDNTDPIPTVSAPFASGLAHYYITTAASPVMQHISEALGSWDLVNTGKDLYKNIISCKILKPPAPIPSKSSVFEIYGVRPQYSGSDITLPEVTGNPTASFGSYRIPRKFNDFRDYAPYTKVEIYLPYCGWTALPSHVVGRSVSVSYFTDIIAGTCKAVVYCNANPVAEAAGLIGLDIPMVSENAGAKAEAVSAGLLAYGKAGLQTALGVGAAVATKGKAGVKTAVSGLENVVSAYAQTAMAFNSNYTEINGRNGDGCCIAGISAIVIKITRPKYGANTDAPYVPAEYSHSTGFVSMKSATVGSFTGLLVADNVDTSGISGATDREKQLIKLYLESGIYVRHPN